MRLCSSHSIFLHDKGYVLRGKGSILLIKFPDIHFLIVPFMSNGFEQRLRFLVSDYAFGHFVSILVDDFVDIVMALFDSVRVINHWELL